jgi:hypothetical protein
MSAWGLVALAFLAGAPASTQGAAASFALVLPEGVVDVSGWEAVNGEFETSVARGTYLFHVNPRRQALYQVMRYRVELLAPTTTLERRRGSGERVAYVRAPGTSEPILCWEREPTGAVPAWHRLVAGTDEYRLEMALLIQVLAAHRVAVRSSSADPPR